MKHVWSILGAIFSLLVVLTSCSDDYLVGGSLQPEQDKIYLYYDTVQVESKTVLVDSVLFRSGTAYLGEYTDPRFGTMHSDFLAQLYCPYQFSFPDDVKRIDSAYLYLYYDEWFGDSASLLHASVY